MSSRRTKSGFIIAAAFIGPGTVTTASLAGAGFGFHLVWALLFSVLATVILQDMAVRLGFATRAGMSHALSNQIKNPLLRRGILLLVVCAIGVGNAAYESGNLTGAAIGLNNIAGLGIPIWSCLLGALAIVLLWLGQYRLIENVLVSLVAVMALVFVLTFAVSQPDWQQMAEQLFTPHLSADSLTTILALIGTTIVPYNLFLHASLVAQSEQESPHEASHYRRQSALAISTGGLITLFIVATAMQAFYGQSESLHAGNLARQLAPLLGDYAQWFFAVGMFAAGLTSAITAPLAAAYALTGALNKPADLRSPWFRGIWLCIILVGIGFSLTGTRPLVAILFAQAANGLLLPVIGLLLLYMMNFHPALGRLKNNWLANLGGVSVILLIVWLSWQKFA
ncbi:Nramp family divalent metal transporter [Alteromonas lipolytica]|uniref:Manganese transporter n=1 Tax=Alteromonas lipolytica TaxID=1856405 RepID=A0A1E8FA07_9ALTE|nr:Nramp family divalent metal transporter [Alteromonas lipolytica]OFI32750.1 manganese transporter [Alteromonas lipolytica]GGF73410.1 manganese transporter [Alteromonas lipolytica]